MDKVVLLAMCICVFNFSVNVWCLSSQFRAERKRETGNYIVTAGKEELAKYKEELAAPDCRNKRKHELLNKHLIIESLQAYKSILCKDLQKAKSEDTATAKTRELAVEKKIRDINKQIEILLKSL